MLKFRVAEEEKYRTKNKFPFLFERWIYLLLFTFFIRYLFLDTLLVIWYSCKWRTEQ